MRFFCKLEGVGGEECQVQKNGAFCCCYCWLDFLGGSQSRRCLYVKFSVDSKNKDFSIMTSLKEALARTSGLHKEALSWFVDHKGKIVPWAEIQSFSSEKSRLVNQAKGIYKPAYSDYALSIRTIQEGPYPDKDVEYRADGSWVLQYFQENPNPTKRDLEATNRGLMKCMNESVPIGALIKRKPKPGVAYEVLGLGLVTDWDDGFFTIEGFSGTGLVHIGADPDAARLRATEGTTSQSFDPQEDRDLRKRAISEVARRRGQAAFRSALLEAYEAKCCVTGCTLKDALEAAHISPYRGDHSNHIQNGLLLRADIHTLFDLGLLTISQDYRIKLSPSAKVDATYADLEGNQLILPDNPRNHPNVLALENHRKWASI